MSIDILSFQTFGFGAQILEFLAREVDLDFSPGDCYDLQIDARS